MGWGGGLRTENLIGLACVWTDSTQAIYRKSLYRKFPETFTQWLTSIRFSDRELYKSRLFRSQGQMLDHLHSHCGGTSYMCHTPKSIGQPSEVVHFLFFKRTLFAQFFATVGLQIRLRSWTTLAGAIGLEMIISARSHEDLSLTCSAQLKKRSCTHYAGLRAGYEEFNICFKRIHDLMGALTLQLPWVT